MLLSFCACSLHSFAFLKYMSFHSSHIAYYLHDHVCGIVPWYGYICASVGLPHLISLTDMSGAGGHRITGVRIAGANRWVGRCLLCANVPCYTTLTLMYPHIFMGRILCCSLCSLFCPSWSIMVPSQYRNGSISFPKVLQSISSF